MRAGILFNKLWPELSLDALGETSRLGSLDRDRHREPGQQAAAGLQAVGRDFRVRRSSSEPPPVSSPGGMVAAPANQVDRCFFGFGGRASSGGRAFASASAARSRKCLLL